MANKSKGYDGKTTIHFNSNVRARAEELAVEAAKAQGRKKEEWPSFTDVVNEALEFYIDFEGDVVGSKMAFAFGVAEQVFESHAMLSAQILALTDLFLDIARITDPAQRAAKLVKAQTFAIEQHQPFIEQFSKARKEQMRLARVRQKAIRDRLKEAQKGTARQIAREATLDVSETTTGDLGE